MECAHRTCGCPFFSWLELFEKKWNARIVRELYRENLGFNELKNKIKGITQGVLSQRLEELQKNGIVTRHVVKEKPLAVEYSLAEKVKAVLNCWEPMQKNELKMKC